MTKVISVSVWQKIWTIEGSEWLGAFPKLGFAARNDLANQHPRPHLFYHLPKPGTRPVKLERLVVVGFFFSLQISKRGLGVHKRPGNQNNGHVNSRRHIDWSCLAPCLGPFSGTRTKSYSWLGLAGWWIRRGPIYRDPNPQTTNPNHQLRVA